MSYLNCDCEAPRGTTRHKLDCPNYVSEVDGGPVELLSTKDVAALTGRSTSWVRDTKECFEIFQDRPLLISKRSVDSFVEYRDTEEAEWRKADHAAKQEKAERVAARAKSVRLHVLDGRPLIQIKANGETLFDAPLTAKNAARLLVELTLWLHP